MPKKLLVLYTDDIIQEKGFDEDNLDKSEVDSIIQKLASRLNVSLQSMQFRVENIRLFSTS